MLQSRSSSRTRAKNLSNSPSPSSRLGRLFPPFGRNSVVASLGSNLLRPVELGSIDPHAMQNDRELTRDCNLGLAEPVALGEPCPQAFTADHFGTRVSRTPAASNRSLRSIASPNFEMRPVQSTSPEAWRLLV